MLNQEFFSVDEINESTKEKVFAPSDKDGLYSLINHLTKHLTLLNRKLEKEAGKKNSAGFQIKATHELSRRVENYKTLQSPSKPFKKFTDFNEVKKLKQSIEKRYGGNLTSEQLSMLVDDEVEKQVCYQLIRFFEEEMLIIYDTYMDLLEGHIAGAKRRLKGRQKNTKKNQEILKQCLQKARTLIDDKKWKGNDYIIFRDLARRDEFKPVFIPTPRVAGGNKVLTDEERNHYLEVSKRSTWAESTLRKFFREQTGKDPTTKKKDL